MSQLQSAYFDEVGRTANDSVSKFPGVANLAAAAPGQAPAAPGQ